MRATQVVGAAFILVGLLLAFNVFPMATVIFPEKFWYQVYPDGSSNNPTLLTPNQQITLKATLVLRDFQTGVDLSNYPYNYWDVTVNVAGQTITLSNTMNTYASADGRYILNDWAAPWTVPNNPGTTYTFSWTAVIKDANKNLVGTSTYTTYGKVALEEPDGMFYINDQPATTTTTLIVFNPQLSLKFTATKNGDKITSVYVEVWKGDTKINTVPLTGSNPTWSAPYTLPSGGAYTLKGYYTWTGSSQPIQKMSILADWENGQIPPWPPPFSVMQIAGVGLIIVGAVLAFKKRW